MVILIGMNISKLNAFTRVVETGTFQKAARSLHRTQPAITKAVKSLEYELGLTLFTHSSYRAELTPKGEKFYKKAKVIIQQVDNLKNYSALLAGKHENHISLAIDVLYPINIFTNKLKTFMSDYPHTEFSLYSETLGGALERLLDNNVDIAISEKHIDDTNLESKPLLKVPLISVATPSYFDKNQNNFSAPELLTQTMQIILSDSSSHRAKYSVGVIEGANAWTVTNLQTKRDLIMAGIGWGSLPKYMIEQDLEKGSLIPLDYPYIQNKTIPLCMIRRRDVEHGPIANEIWDAFIN